MVATEWTPEAIMARVTPYFQDVKVGDLSFTVGDPGEIYLSHGYWRVPIHPSFWPERLFPAIEELADVESKIRKAEELKIILVLAEPIEEVAPI